MKSEGKVVLITGAGSGIGRAQALALSKEGAKIVIADVNQEGIDESIKLINAQGGTAIGFKANIADSAQVNDLVAIAIAKFSQIDILCNTAGIFDNYRTALDTTEEQFDLMYNVMLKLYSYFVKLYCQTC